MMSETPTPAKQAPAKVAFDPAALAGQAQETDPIKNSRASSSVMANNPYVQHMVRSLETKKALEMPVPADQAHTFVSWLRDAAKKNGNGLRVQYIVGSDAPTSDPKKVPKTGSVKVRYQATAKKGGEAIRTTCPVCKREGVSLTMEGKIRSHKVDGAVCAGSGQTPVAETPAASEAPAPTE